ncbi:MAG: transcriptional regulator [Candidatus Thorarchaeota archaeon]
MSKNDLALEQRLSSIEDKIDRLTTQISQIAATINGIFPDISLNASNDVGPRPFDGLDFARLPKHLQKTLRCLQLKGQATASEIADTTKKERAVESDYLNQLHIMGLVGKKRHKRSMIFYVANSSNEGTSK